MPRVEISLIEIIKYVGDRVRPLREGEEVFKAGHIILCGVSDNLIKSLCLQTSALTSPPHEVKIALSDDVTNWMCSCTCKSGMSGYCKHIIATLIYINRHEELETISCTDLTQKWGKEKKGLETTCGPRKISNFCHPERKNHISFQISKETYQENFNLLVDSNKTSAISKFLERSKNEEQVVRIFYSPQLENLLLNMQNNKFLMGLQLENKNLMECCQRLLYSLSKFDFFEVASCKQRSNTWMKERQFRITGSRCYEIYTCQKENRIDWVAKTTNYFCPRAFDNEYMKHGRLFEKEALKKYATVNRYQVHEFGLIISDLCPWLGFSPDGVVFQNSRPTKLVEIKCPYIGKEVPSIEFIHLDYLELSAENGLKLKKKHKYYGQIQLGLAILNLKQCDLILYSTKSKSFLNIVVTFDEEFAKKLIETITYKYFTYMIHVGCGLSK